MCSKINTVIIPSCRNYSNGMCLYISDIEKEEIPCRVVILEDCEVKEVFGNCEQAIPLYTHRMNLGEWYA